jgi:hypothetical protein
MSRRILLITCAALGAFFLARRKNQASEPMRACRQATLSLTPTPQEWSPEEDVSSASTLSVTRASEAIRFTFTRPSLVATSAASVQG